jgi:IS30 family transposase
VSKLVASPELAEVVAERLKKRWSPEQIAGWLRRMHPDDPELWVSHETIYRSLFVQTKGVLNHELTGCLRTKRVMRRPRGANKYRSKTMGQLADMVNIRERPAEAEDRAVPGHWEGDLICGTGGSAVATLVERSTRFTQLVRIEKITSETVAAALGTHIVTLPEQVRRSLTLRPGQGDGPSRAAHHRHRCGGVLL